jgi:glycosyltransferase involved in cell wall biosynthesis
MLSAFDVFALTSKTEGLPLALLEAMATELPVVSSAVGGIPDVIDHGITGFLFRSGGTRSLTKQLVHLFGSQPAAREIGARGRLAIAQKHSVERMTHSYDALYRKVVAASRGLSRSAPAALGAE